MRITFVMDGGDNLSGGHRAIAVYADRLAALGHQVSLVARPQRRPTLRDQARSLCRGQGWISTAKPRTSHFERIAVPLQLIDRRRPIQNADVPDADVVLATWWETAGWVAGLAPSKGVKVHFMQDYEVWGGPVERVDLACGLPIPKIVSIAWVSDLLEKRFNQTPIAVIPYGVEKGVFDAPPRSKQPVPTFGFTYATLHNKGCDITIQACRLAHQIIPNLRLIAFGNTRISKDLPLPKDTHYESYASDRRLSELYSQCDGWLFGTRREGFGLPILEAMACRTPVIGTPAGAAPQLLGDGAGLMVKPEDPEDMARAIVQLTDLSDIEWRRMSDAAYSKASKYSWEESARAFEAALQHCIDRSQAELPL